MPFPFRQCCLLKNLLSSVAEQRPSAQQIIRHRLFHNLVRTSSQDYDDTFWVRPEMWRIHWNTSDLCRFLYRNYPLRANCECTKKRKSWQKMTACVLICRAVYIVYVNLYHMTLLPQSSAWAYLDPMCTSDMPSPIQSCVLLSLLCHSYLITAEDVFFDIFVVCHFSPFSFFFFFFFGGGVWTDENINSILRVAQTGLNGV